MSKKSKKVSKVYKPASYECGNCGKKSVEKKGICNRCGEKK